MNKAELIDVLTDKLGSDRRHATAAVENVVDTIVRAVHKGDSVTITGFGVFEQRRRAARVARNPAYRRDGEGEADLRAGIPARRTIQSGCLWRATTPGGRTCSEAWCCRKRWSQEGGQESARQEGGRQEGSGQEGRGQATARPRRRLRPRRPRPSGSGQEGGSEEGSGQEGRDQADDNGREEGSGQEGRDQAGSGQEGRPRLRPRRPRPVAVVAKRLDPPNADSPRNRLS